MRLILFLLFAYTVMCQDRLDPHPILDSLTVNSSIFSTTEHQFIKGWNWSSQSRKLDSVLGNNFNHTGISTELLLNTNMYKNNTKFILAVGKNDFNCLLS